MRTKQAWQRIGFICLGLIGFMAINAQELEPRALTTLPQKTNFLAAGYLYSFGNMLLDPAIPIEDLNSNMHVGYLAYVRSFGLFGNSSKISVMIPFADADFEGVAFGRDSTRTVSGMGDPVMVISTNFRGSPALSIQDYTKYKQGTVVGANIKIRFPLGQYDEMRTLNIGSNRFMFRPQLGVSVKKNKWIIETYAAVWLFTVNNEFWVGDQTVSMQQKPLFTLKQHLIYAFKNKSWFAVNLGYGIGGSTVNEGKQLNNRINTFRFGATFVKPFARNHAIKLSYDNAIAFEKGPDFQAINITYQFRWINK